MNPALAAALITLAEEIAAAYQKYESAKAAIPTAADVDAAMLADVASVQSSIKADRDTADLAESIKFPADAKP